MQKKTFFFLPLVFLLRFVSPFVRHRLDETLVRPFFYSAPCFDDLFIQMFGIGLRLPILPFSLKHLTLELYFS